MKPTLLMLAAGIGSRYGGLKQIDPVGPHGETIMDYSVYDAIRAGFGKLVFIIRRDIEDAFRAAIGSRFSDKITVEYAFQELDLLPEGYTVPLGRKKPWGTAHAVLAANGAVQEPFAVINCDDFYGAESFRILGQFLESLNDPNLPTVQAEYCMVGFTLSNTLSEHGSVSRGICTADPHGFLTHVVERTHIEQDGGSIFYMDGAGQKNLLSGAEIVSMNMWGFTPSIFAHLDHMFAEFLRAHGHEEKSEFFLPFAVNDLIAGNQARVTVLRSESSWFGVTYQEDKPIVQRSIRKLIAEGAYPEWLWGNQRA